MQVGEKIIVFFFLMFIYLAALGLGCSTWDLGCVVWIFHCGAWAL